MIESDKVRRLPAALSGFPQKPGRSRKGDVPSREATRWYKKFDSLLKNRSITVETRTLLAIDDPLVRALLCIYFVPLSKEKIRESKFPFYDLADRSTCLAADIERFIALHPRAQARLEREAPFNIPFDGFIINAGRAFRLLPSLLRFFAENVDARSKNVSEMAQGTKAVKSRAVICLFDLVRQATHGTFHSMAESLVELFDIGAEAAGIKEEKKPYYSADRLLHVSRRYAKEHPEDHAWTILNLHRFRKTGDSSRLDALFVSPLRD